MITAEEARRAVDYLLTSAAEYAAAIADRDKAEHMVKVAKALAMRASGETSAAAQEREALLSDAYKKAVDDLWQATRDAEKLKAERAAAMARIEFWRSWEATHREATRGMHSARGAA